MTGVWQACILCVLLASLGTSDALDFGDLTYFYDNAKAFFFGESFAPVSSNGQTPGQSPSTRQTRTGVTHFNNVTVIDYMQDHPKVRIGHRVVDLFSGWHFDDILMDSPDEIRPPSVVAFFDSSNPKCLASYKRLNFDSIAERQLPARSRLFTARYDMHSAPKRPWYEFTPEMDLQKRFNVQSCPEVVFTSSKCDGMTEWCVRGQDEENPDLVVYGCDDYKESCPSEYRKVWDGKTNLVEWINKLVEDEGVPKLSEFLGSYEMQGRWMKEREYTTSNTHFRNIYMAQAFPAFTPRGFKAVETPKEVQDWLLSFRDRQSRRRKTERWNTVSTQMSFHEHPSTFIDMDLERAAKNAIANKYLKPIVEEWSGIAPLELTAFYGIREYHENSFLREHIDRIDTHVLSITISIAKFNEPENAEPWPLRVTDFTGKQVSYDHPAGTMILYESSKVPHGRPTPNKGGSHVGAFVHFKPKHMHGSEAEKWDSVAKGARDNVHAHMISAQFKATPEIEIENPVYAEQSYGEGSDYDPVTKKGKTKTTDNGQYSVEFKNRSDRTLRVFWYSNNIDKPVFQGEAWPNAGFTVNTFTGHTFFWAESDSEDPLPGGRVTIDPGKRLYTYSLSKSGKQAQV